MSRLSTLGTVLLVLLPAACTVGPDFVRPIAPSQPRFAHGTDVAGPVAGIDQPAPTAAANATVSAAADGAFWREFGDPKLTALVEDALAANHDLRIALSRHDRANALLRGAKFDALPTVRASAGVVDGRESADQVPGVSRGDRDAKSYSAGVNAAWELDLFGRIRRNVEAGRADAEASAAELQAAQIAIVGQVARIYVELRGL